MNKKSAYFYIIFFSLIVIMFFLLPKSKCCDNDDPETLRHEANIVAATQGDPNAARILYYDYLKNDHKGQAFTWLRIGAINGANDLVVIYVSEYKKMSVDFQKKEIEILEKNKQKSNVQVILSQINM